MSDLTSTGQFVSRFANPKRTKPVSLGPCRCPGQPHADGDSAQVRAEIGDGELHSAQAVSLRYRERSAGEQAELVTMLAAKKISQEQYERGVAEPFAYVDQMLATDSSLARFTSSWTLLDDDGEAVPITLATIQSLDEPTHDALIAALGESISGRALPNASGAPSPGSPPASGSPTPTPTKRR